MKQTGERVVDDGETVSKGLSSLFIKQDVGKVKKMMQSPVDDSLVVFTGK